MSTESVGAHRDATDNRRRLIAQSVRNILRTAHRDIQRARKHIAAEGCFTDEAIAREADQQLNAAAHLIGGVGAQINREIGEA